MWPLPSELYLSLHRFDTERHLRRLEHRRIAEARRRVDRDRRELQRAWNALDNALKAESRSRHELAALTR